MTDSLASLVIIYTRLSPIDVHLLNFILVTKKLKLSLLLSGNYLSGKLYLDRQSISLKRDSSVQYTDGEFY